MKKLKIISQYKYIFILIICIIYSLIINNLNIKSKYDVNETNIEGYISSYIIDGNKLQIEINGKEKIIGTYYFEKEDEIYKFKKNYKLGDIVLIDGVLKLPSNNTIPNLFNYKKYLRQNNINYIIEINSITKLKDNNMIRYKVKNHISSLIEKSINKEYLYTFILGNSKYIDSDVINSYRINGISHLFAVSGMHVSLLSLIILKIFCKFKYKNILVILILMFYMFLTDFSPSILRAGIFFILLYIKKKFKLKISNINLMLILLSILIIFDPYIIYKVGFIYSYTISFYLILFNKLIQKSKFKILMVSLISFMVSLPITINNFFSINLLSIFLNIIFVPLISSVIFPLSLITLVIPVLGPVLKILINIFETLSLFTSNINILILTMQKMDTIFIIFYYILITFILYKMLKGKYCYLVILLAVILIHSNINLINNKKEMVLIDVGQGDSILIKMPYDKSNILIDTGGMEEFYKESWKIRNNSFSVGNSIITYLKSIGINRIDYLILTHGDADHMGESINLVNNFKVNNVIFNLGDYNILEKELINILVKKGITYKKNIEVLNIDKYKLHFLNTKIYDNENDNSNVIYTEIDNTKILFMGDAGIEKEIDILDEYEIKNIDILKVGHHGSNTSSSKYFIDSIKPKTCLISVGKNNRYNHPKDSVLDILNECDIYRTDLNGSIKIEFKDSNYNIKTLN